MIVTATEFKNNMGKYLDLAVTEDIFITKNGKHIAKLSNTKEDKIALAKSLFGVIASADTTLEQAREERRARYESID